MNKNRGKQPRKPKGTVARLLALLGRDKLRMVFIVLSLLASSYCILYAPRVVGDAIDVIAPGANFTQPLIRKLVLLLVLYLAGSLFAGIAGVLATNVTNSVVKFLRVRLFHKLNKLPLKYLDRTSRGDIMSRFSGDIDAIAEGLNQGIVQLISGVITIILCLVFMISLDFKVSLVVIISTPICFLAGYIITRSSRKSFTEQTHTVGVLNGYAEELISGQNTVKAFGYEGESIEKFNKINHDLYECGYRAQFASAMTNPSTRVVTNSTYVAVGIVGIFSVISGVLSKGAIASFLSYALQFSKPVNSITSVTLQIQLAISSAKRVFAVLDVTEEAPDSENAAVLSHAIGAVRFENVSFGYSENRILIKDFSLDIKPGTKVAIVGPTGAGKTTLINLLMRFYEVNSGRILIDGIDIRDITRDSLRRNFGMVLQETWLFGGTIGENIAYGNPELLCENREEIESAARLSYAHGFIRRLPEQYDTVIAPDGGNLSGGQKQLLTIARTMLLDTPMLILDEATSSVDILTEQRIQKAFKALMQNKTSFVIAHRLSTIKDADLILVLNEGNIVEQGSHDELIAAKGFYNNLYHAQFVD